MNWDVEYPIRRALDHGEHVFFAATPAVRRKWHVHPPHHPDSRRKHRRKRRHHHSMSQSRTWVPTTVASTTLPVPAGASTEPMRRPAR